ncbi:cytochrome P450 3A8-like [Uloborus diversus]|uniref:cytochrome P450 3A8-like n=1 Tax=Uloborus diversus TaxID=327109 RepID=UPI00240A466A|nr:cytochrome P450 3A8-like [Uloborus diversus]
MEALGFGNVATSILAGIALILFYCWYSTRHYQYWKEINVPFVKPWPVFGSLFETYRQSLHVFEIERYKKYGEVYGHFEGSRPVLSVADPVLLRKILVKDFNMFPNRRTFVTGEPSVDLSVASLEGEDWKRVRSIITPTFTTGKLKRMISIFKEGSQVCVNNFMQYAKSGKPVDVKIFFEAFGMDIIASTAFSTKVDSQNDPQNKFVTSAREFFKKFFGWRFLLFLTFPKFVKFMRLSALPLTELYFFRDMALKIIEERKNTGKVRNDFLQLLLDTAKETEDKETREKEADNLTENYGKEELSEQLFKTAGKKQLSNIEVVAQCVLFFFAGFDATASAMSFVFYELALNPDVQEKLIAEIDEVLASSDGKLTYDTIQNMKTLDNVISESLRIFPPAVRLERVAHEDYDLGYKGIKLTKDMIVTIPCIAIHNDPKYYPEPEKFNPDRFLPEERAKRDQLVYMPFGFGPRNCIGMRFVLIAMKVCIAFLLSNFKFKKCSQTKVPIEFLPSQILLRPKEIMLQLEIRKDSIKAK